LEILKLSAGGGRYRDAREELVPLWTDPPVAIPLAVVVTKLLLAPENAARLSKATVAAYSLTPKAIYRLRAWQHSA
jgi:hypothetical protein